MVTESEYQQKIRAFKWSGLSKLWNAVKKGDTPGWDSGRAFEYLILRAFELDGAEVRWPYNVEQNGVIIEQIDGVVYVDGISCLIECKDRSRQKGRKENINFEPIAKMRNQLMKRPSTVIGCIFSSGGFTRAAFILANFIHPQTILLWNGDEVTYCLEKKIFSEPLVGKYRKSVELGIYDYDITNEMEEI